MALLRIPRNELTRATTFALSHGLLVDRIYGDRDKQFVSISARRAGPMGNHEPRWSPAERALLVSIFDAPASALTCESRCADEVDHFSDALTTAELEQYARRTTKRPLLWFAVLAALPFVGEGLCRLLGA